MSGHHPTPADRAVSENLRDIAARLAKDVDGIAGEHMGIALLIFPLNRLAPAQYIANVDREDMKKQLQDLLDHWSKGMPDIPAHNRQ